MRPVEIEIPPDTLFASDDVELLPGVERPERSAGDPDLIEQAAKLLGNAEEPGHLRWWRGDPGGCVAPNCWNWPSCCRRR